jgi:hypothetical protein
MNKFALTLILLFFPAMTLAQSLTRPPGARLATLPRVVGDKSNETSVAVNPRDPRNVIISYQQPLGEGADHYPGQVLDGHVAWTADGGKTWAVAPGTVHEGYRKSFDTSVTFDLHGHAFVVNLEMDDVVYTGRHGVYVRRSPDGGRSWEGPITLIERPGGQQQSLMEDHPVIVADNGSGSRFAGNLYVVWCRGLDHDKIIEIAFARSTDDGKTWSKPMVIRRQATVTGYWAAVGRDGTVYLIDGLQDHDSEILLEVSHDGGQTFEDPHRVTRFKMTDSQGKPWKVENFPRAFGMPNIAVDTRHSPERLFVVWGDCRYGDMDILSTTSTDGGRTWTQPVRVNNDPKSDGKDQVMQALAVDSADGAAYVIFYDRRVDPKNLLPSVTLARSTDGGRTFANYAWSVTTPDPKQASLGDYIGLAAQGGHVYGAWPEDVAAEQKKPKAAPRKFMIADSLVSDLDWPFGPAAIRVGIADFEKK